MTEADFQTAVIEVAHSFGWMVSHFRPAMTKHGWRTPVSADGKGFPDLVLVHPRGGVLFRECKSERGKLSDEQTRWATRLSDAGADFNVWRPSDMPDIINRLSFGRARSNL